MIAHSYVAMLFILYGQTPLSVNRINYYCWLSFFLLLLFSPLLPGSHSANSLITPYLT